MNFRRECAYTSEIVRIYKGSSGRRFSQVRRFRRNSKHTVVEFYSNWRENIYPAYTLLLVIQNIANPLIPFLQRAAVRKSDCYMQALHRICIKRKRNSPLPVFTWITLEDSLQYLELHLDAFGTRVSEYAIRYFITNSRRPLH